MTILIVGTIVGGTLMLVAGAARPGIEAWLKEDLPSRSRMLLGGMAVAMCLPLLAMAGYLWRLGQRVAFAQRFPPPGTVFGAFLVGYGLCRVVVEFFREPDAQIGFIFGSISMGQLLSIPMIVAGAVILAVAWGRRGSLQTRSIPQP